MAKSFADDPNGDLLLSKKFGDVNVVVRGTVDGYRWSRTELFRWVPSNRNAGQWEKSTLWRDSDLAHLEKCIKKVREVTGYRRQKAQVKDDTSAPSTPAPETETRPAEASGHTPCELEQQLIDLGLDAGFSKKTSAGSLVRDFPAEKVKLCARHYESISARNDKFGLGYLIASIRSDDGRGFVPDDFSIPDESEPRPEAKQASAAVGTGRRTTKPKRQIEEKNDAQERFNEMLAGVPTERRIELEDEAFGRCKNPLIVEFVRDARRTGSVGVWHRMLWEEYILPHSGSM